MTTDKDRPNILQRRAAAQRRYAQRLKATKAPRADDLGRALIRAARICIGPNPAEDEKAIWTHFIATTVDELAAQGFSRRQASRRLLKALRPQGPISG